MKMLRKTRKQHTSAFYGIVAPMSAGRGRRLWHFAALAD